MRGKPRDGGQRCDILGSLRSPQSVMLALLAERLFALFDPQLSRPFADRPVELFGHPKRCAVDRRANIAGP